MVGENSYVQKMWEIINAVTIKSIAILAYLNGVTMR